jgi:hypothetical protein
MRTIEQLLLKLATEGGCLVASADCSAHEIADARVREDWYVTDDGLGYVRRLPDWLQKHSRYARKADPSSCCELRKE